MLKVPTNALAATVNGSAVKGDDMNHIGNKKISLLRVNSKLFNRELPFSRTPPLNILNKYRDHKSDFPPTLKIRFLQKHMLKGHLLCMKALVHTFSESPLEYNQE